jgi:hypothetical protein
VRHLLFDCAGHGCPICMALEVARSQMRTRRCVYCRRTFDESPHTQSLAVCDECMEELNDSLSKLDPMSKPHSDKRSQPETDSASNDGQMGADEGAS